MHSRIFKIQTDLTEPYEKIRESVFENNGFIDGYHDYVAYLDEKETLESYKWLVENCCFKKVFRNFRKEGDYYLADINKTDVVAYLDNVVDEIKKQIENLENYNFYEIQQLAGGDTSGFYFFVDFSYYTDTEFLSGLYKYYFEKSDTITIRFEGALDYHS